jgi:5-methylcytosine-specific restriction endonuclease McrA
MTVMEDYCAEIPIVITIQSHHICWHYHNFYWDRIRSDIFKRDNYVCQICKRRYPYTYRRKFARSNKLECDHIIPKSLYKQYGYEFDTLENKVKATLEFLHNPDNLRTLCHTCHKQVTVAKHITTKNLGKLERKENIKEYDDIIECLSDATDRKSLDKINNWVIRAYISEKINEFQYKILDKKISEYYNILDKRNYRTDQR